jgi:hypothetical protein
MECYFGREMGAALVAGMCFVSAMMIDALLFSTAALLTARNIMFLP